MAISTKVISLTAVPLDLAQDPDIAAALAAQYRVELAIQNVASGKTVVLKFAATAPAAASRDGFVLRYGDLTIVEIEGPGDPLWAWSTTTASIAVNEA